MTRLERLLDLVHVLQTTRAPVSLDAIREQFPDYADGSPETTRRKFERDKAELAAIGLVLRFVDADTDEGGGYLLDADASYLPPMELGDRERALLAGAARAALGTDALPHRGALRLALAKLDADGRVDARELPVIVPSWVDDPAPSEHLEVLGDALARRKRVRIRYRKPGAEPTWRDVEPYALFAKSGVWHLSGFDHARGTRRLFRVSRILELEVNGKKPTQPDFTLPEDLHVPELTRVDPLTFEVNAPLTCRVAVDPEVAFLMRSAWGEPDERGVFVIETTNLGHLVQQVLALGLRAEILDPPEARDEIRDALRAVLDAHAGLDLMEAG